MLLSKSPVNVGGSGGNAPKGRVVVVVVVEVEVVVVAGPAVLVVEVVDVVEVVVVDGTVVVVVVVETRSNTAVHILSTSMTTKPSMSQSPSHSTKVEPGSGEISRVR